MGAHDPLDILLRHNRWAMRAVIEACAGLSREQFHRRFEMGPGSLHDTLAHTVSALRAWGDMLAGREPRARLEGGDYTPAQLLEIFETTAEEFDGVARAHPTGETVTGTRGGRSYTFTRGCVITHVTTHGMHHRAQCLNMLRRLGVEKLPPSSVMEWTLMGEAST